MKSFMNEEKSGCLICGKDLIYLQSSEKGICVYCNKEFDINERCVDGHYICDKCHSSGAMDIIEEFCQTTNLENPITMATTLMKHPSVKMHGPEHHFLVPAVLLASYNNHIDIADKSPGHKSTDDNNSSFYLKLTKARKRAEFVPGGFCGTHGNCGAGVGTGIYISLLLEATPLSQKEWQLCNQMTAESLLSIAKCGGPRCCKRDTYLAINQAVDFMIKNFNISIPIESDITCGFSAYNKECKLEECPFYNTQN